MDSSIIRMSVLIALTTLMQPVYMSPKAPDSLMQSAHVTPKTPDSLMQSTHMTPKAPHSLMESAHVTPKTPDSMMESAHVTPKAPDSMMQSTHMTPKAPHSLMESKHMTPKAPHSLMESAHVTPKTPDSLMESAHVTPKAPDSMMQSTHMTPKAPHSLMESTHVTPKAPHLLMDSAHVTPKTPDSLMESTHVTPKSPDSLMESTHVTPNSSDALMYPAHMRIQVSDTESQRPSLCDRKMVDLQYCNLTVWNRSIEYFRAKLDKNEPHFIHFDIELDPPVKFPNATPQSFKPGEWFWTYKSTTGLLPYLYWNIDYSILSFGLLDAKTLRKDDLWIQLTVPANCSITYGSRETTCAIGRAFTGMISTLVHSSSEYLKYESSYFCFLAENSTERDTKSYMAAVYFLYPISYINYNCCESKHSYTKNTFYVDCKTEQIGKWSQCTIGPYILGVIIFLYFPIWMFKIASWISSDEEVVSSEYEMLDPSFAETDERGGHRNQGNDGWVYLDGYSPYTFTDLLAHVWCGFHITWPMTVSRIRRLVMLLLMPLGVYIHIYVYKQYFLENTKLLLKHETPMGFLSILGEDFGKRKVFVPILGGPVGLAILYYSIGLLFLVVPRSLKQVFEDGMPTQGSRFKSPLFLSVSDIKLLSMAEGSLEPGYAKGMTMFKCGFLMLFTKLFWKHVFRVHYNRMFNNAQNSLGNAVFILKLVTLPFYAALCIAEIILCLLLYGFPLCMFIVVVIRGSTRSLSSFRTYMAGHFSSSSLLNRLILNNRLLRFLIGICTAGLILLFSYVNSLVFIETFQFIAQIIVYCFVAIIVFPSYSFGYLFFSVVLCYYIIRRIRDFGDCYLELLSEVVELSRKLAGQPNYASQGETQPAVNETSVRPRVKMVDNVYAIPRDLFTYIVRKRRPAHQQLLKMAFNIGLICGLLYMTLSISRQYVAGPSSEISEVMHVIFIVAVGALPHIVEGALTSGDKSVTKEIESRKLEQSIVAFWGNIRVEI